MSMLLTLSTRSLASKINSKRDSMTLLDVPGFVMEQLQLRGLNVSASMLSGWTLEDLDKLRDRADKAGCPCLVLVEDQALPFAHAKEATRAEAVDRMVRLGVAAHRLGCNALAIKCDAKDNENAFDLAATEIKDAMPKLERLELNVLLAPGPGLTASPDRLTDLIKRIGGFRIGSLPNFDAAAKSGDVVENLRKLAPYAGAIHASVSEFDGDGVHKGYDLAECVHAIRKVGFENTLAIEFLGTKDPVENIDRAREQLQAAIDEE